MHISGKDCRNIFYRGKNLPLRSVPAFTYQALQKNTIVEPPPRIYIYKKKPVKGTMFKMYFRRGDIPVAKRIKGSGEGATGTVKWFCDPKDLDYCYYLPIFVDGLADSDIDIRSLAQEAAMDLILKAPHKILPVLPKLILPLKRAFNTHDKRIIISALKVLQTMVLVGPCVGQALVPYYRQLLAVCNLYKNINVNLGSGVDPDRSRRIGDVIEDTLSLLETCGGANAFINIKYMIPTYESSTHPICTPSAGKFGVDTTK
ncbi:parkin coregulated gene protein homolog [Anastrepha ludens]|uniref:parkin coregulated gene protein homolog n=1 Tax=Anastrepha ludens TaxID=28586 RepID=UPI0023B0B57B|nr:parkin coregulated gene protein homolog [Anastrepha ludens]XP_053955527.1 parkin coregulated gene protein homolog [Anastrepha ludens]XP_053955528.1 parkin coregulated gene protein homolog [Anastrepha ludens]